MFEKGDSENNLSEVLGPFMLNSSIICLNSSLLHTQKTNTNYLPTPAISKLKKIKTSLTRLKHSTDTKKMLLWVHLTLSQTWSQNNLGLRTSFIWTWNFSLQNMKSCWRQRSSVQGYQKRKSWHRFWSICGTLSSRWW